MMRYVRISKSEKGSEQSPASGLIHRQSADRDRPLLHSAFLILLSPCHFRMAADLPCASRLSISANFCTAFCAFFSAARLYSTMLVRRWN